MTATFEQARDEMFALFTERFDAMRDGVEPWGEMRYQGRLYTNPLDAAKYNVVCSLKPVTSREDGFVTRDDPGKSAKPITSKGLFTAQIFAPLNVRGSYNVCAQLAEVGRIALSGQETPSSVWFRNVRSIPLDDDGKSWRFNVVAEYSFDT